MPPEIAADDYDTPWKGALEHAFPEFMEFYFPDAAHHIDWSRGHLFLDKELRQIVRGAELGRRHVDKLVRVHRFDGTEDWIAIHVEVQSQHDDGFAKRMFVYNYRIFDRYDRPVASLAVLADDNPNWRPNGFGFEVFGCSHQLNFPVVKLTDFVSHEDALAVDINPFALVTAAHLYTQRTRNAPVQRLEVKRRLVRTLYQRDWSKARVLEFFAILDWMMQLPEDLELELWQDIESIEGEFSVKYVTSVERLAIARGERIGIEKGIAKGIEKGIEKGIATGIERGAREGSANLLKRQLIRRFGALPAAICERLADASTEQIEQWGERVLIADTLEDVFREN